MHLPADLWTSRYDPGVPTKLEIPSIPFQRLMDDAGADAPSLTAIQYFGRCLTYAELCAESMRVAAGLQHREIRAHTRVIVALPPCVEWAVAHLAVWRTGAAVVAGRPAWTRGEWRSVNESTRPDLAIVTRRGAINVRRACPELPVVVVDPIARLSWPWRIIRWFFGPGRPPALRGEGRRTAGDRSLATHGLHGVGSRATPSLAWSSLADERRPLAESPSDPDAPALVVPLPGKRVFAHRHLVAGALQLQAWLSDVAPGEATWLVTVPPDSVLGVVASLGAIPAQRARWYVTPRGDIGTLLDAVAEARPSHILSDAMSIATYATDPTLVHLDARSLRVWLVAGAVDAELCRTFEELSDIELCQGYGSDDAAGLVCCNPVNGRRVAGSVGLPLPGIGVFAAEGSQPSGVTKQLRFVGPNLLNAEAVLGGAVTNPGADAVGASARFGLSPMDAQMDEAGFVYVLGPAKSA